MHHSPAHSTLAALAIPARLVTVTLCLAVWNGLALAETPLDIPAPELPRRADFTDPGPSFLRLPVEISLAPIVEQLERNIATTQGTGEAFRPFRENVEVRYGLQRDPLLLKVKNSELRVTSRLFYWLHGRSAALGDGLCASPADPVLVEGGVHGTIGWLDDWRLGIRLSAMPNNFSRRCKPEELAINFTGLLNDEINTWVTLPLLSQIDSLLAGTDRVSRVLEEAWAALQAPVQLQGPGNWLSFGVEAVHAGQLGGAAQTVTTELALITRPRFLRSEAPPSYSTTQLPDTRVRLLDDRVRVVFEAELALATVNQRLADRIVTPPATDSQAQIQVSSVRAFGGGDRLAVAIDADGIVEGTFFLVGKLVYDPSVLGLAVEELEYSTDTRTALAKHLTGPARAAAFEEIRRAVADLLRFDVKDQITADLIRIGRALNHQMSPHVSIRGGAMQRQLLGTYANENVIGVRLAAVGKATLSFDDAVE